MPPDPPLLGVLIVHHGSPAATLRCLGSVEMDTSAMGCRIVLVDNSAGTGSELDAARVGSRALLVRCPDNPGFGGGAHRGIAALGPPADYFAYVILNHDVEISPGYLDAAAAALGEGVAAAAGPLYLDHPEGTLWYAGGTVRWLTGTVQQSRRAADALRPRDVGFLPGTAFIVCRRAWEQVGGFDQTIFLYHEDVDLCLRLRRAGWRLRFDPGMVAVHHLGTTTGSALSSPFYLEHLTGTRFRPYRSRLYKTYLALIHTPYVALRALILLARNGRPGVAQARALARGHLTALSRLWRP